MCFQPSIGLDAALRDTLPDMMQRTGERAALSNEDEVRLKGTARPKSRMLSMAVDIATSSTGAKMVAPTITELELYFPQFFFWSRERMQCRKSGVKSDQKGSYFDNHLLPTEQPTNSRLNESSSFESHDREDLAIEFRIISATSTMLSNNENAAAAGEP
ncbi:uncharacterized protein MEPE_02742 [Melanopsichium pennsylvanicum]|uniref:Uncharacterized protein n=1 Tax=Melanopsichium pennsylvanicum TaxID=63383 RepID=A0AAJ4XKI5_9BASI|nr:uncharacterized protein MEPE_02742 [Melanopsichium pennsylvanicum]